ncbi:hypothetical protein AVEN_112582-1 [Araneus ventricosus]|uniref:Secreted protein n=1 Tax=Araneus ventricosus TaxID=182803 RepID=A0A4Y2W2L1_ARAVE|nr:hypothetical protein AVEN_29299-1 [Araneus ventricosus]GBO30791.1 hypothetical protein AVEN_112582-1 [Araneus ventricosus]
MFTLPALLYLKLLPLFGQCLYHFIVPNKSRPPHAGGALPAGPLPALHPFWVGRASVGIFAPHQCPSIPVDSKPHGLLFPLYYLCATKKSKNMCNERHDLAILHRQIQVTLFRHVRGDQGCHIGLFKAKLWKSGLFSKPLALGIFIWP